jgi:hypothetical protein
LVQGQLRNGKISLGIFAAADIPNMIQGTAEQTKELLGWKPVHPGLIVDIEQGHCSIK